MSLSKYIIYFFLRVVGLTYVVKNSITTEDQRIICLVLVDIVGRINDVKLVPHVRLPRKDNLHG